MLCQECSPEPVGLEYTIRAVTCVFCELLGLSGGDLILVGEPAEDLFSTYPVLGEVDLRWPRACLGRCELAEGAVRPGVVVVLQVFGAQRLPRPGYADRVIEPYRMRWGRRPL